MNTYPQALLGWRVWRVKKRWHQPSPRGEDERDLLSWVTGGEVWVKGEQEARCLWSFHDAPHHKCHCGFNAFHSLQGALDLRRGGPTAVAGAILARGRAQIHTEGFRAEKAVVVALLRVSKKISKRRMDRIASHYSVPWFKTQEEISQYVSQKFPEARPAPTTSRPQLSEEQLREYEADKRAMQVYRLEGVCARAVMILLFVSAGISLYLASAIPMAVAGVIACAVMCFFLYELPHRMLSRVNNNSPQMNRQADPGRATKQRTQ